MNKQIEIVFYITERRSLIVVVGIVVIVVIVVVVVVIFPSLSHSPDEEQSDCSKICVFKFS